MPRIPRRTSAPAPATTTAASGAGVLADATAVYALDGEERQAALVAFLAKWPNGQERTTALRRGRAARIAS